MGIPKMDLKEGSRKWSSRSRSTQGGIALPTTTPTPGIIASATSLPTAFPVRSDDEDKIPENAEPLPAELLCVEKIGTWESEEVCRWLGMKTLKMEKLGKKFWILLNKEEKGFGKSKL